MPTLNNINCSLEINDSSTKLVEYNRRYADRAVKVFVAVPSVDAPFRVHITTNGYVAQGIAAFVYIDGRYQCNRNRMTPASDDGIIELILRQKEEKSTQGYFVGRDWRFTNLGKGESCMHIQPVQHLTCHIASSNASVDKDFLKNVGIIDVFILRCRSRSSQSARFGGTSDGRRDQSLQRQASLPQYDGSAEDDANWRHPLLKASYSFNQQASVPVPNDSQDGRATGSRTQPRRDGPLTNNMSSQDEAHLRMIHSYFNDIECSATAFRTINDKIEFLENAIRDARLKAPDLGQSLTVEQEKAIRERDDHERSVGALLDTALSHMYQLSDKPWRLCRDFVINAGWLEADHPALCAPREHEADMTIPRQQSDSQDQERGRAQLFNQWLEHQNRVKLGPRMSTTGHANNSCSDRPIDVSPAHLSFENDRNDQDRWGWKPETLHQDSVHESNRQWQAEADEDPWRQPSNKDAPPLTDGNDSWSQRSRVQSATGSAHVHKSNLSSSGVRVVKPYWKTSLGNHAAGIGDTNEGPRDPYIYPAEQPPAVPKGHKREVKYSVQIGKGVEYLHNLGTPEYLDTMDNPFAVFTFKYRSAEELQKLVGKGVQDDLRTLTEKIRRQQLLKLPRGELVEQLMRSKTHEASNSARSDGQSRRSRSWGASEPKPESKADWLKSSTPNKSDWLNNQEPKHESKTDWLKPNSHSSRHKNERNDMKSSVSSKSHDHFRNGKRTKSTSKANAGWQQIGEENTGAAW
jgi:hypothetical protein